MLSRDYDRLVLAAGQNAKERDFWLNKLAGDLVKSGFPYDYNNKVGYNYNLTPLKFSFSGDLFSELLRMARGSDVKLHMILMAGLVMLLEKYSGHRDIIIGIPIYKQDVEIDFVNTVLMIRNRIDENMAFKEILLSVRDNIIEATDNQNYPLEILSEQLNFFHGENDVPLVDVVLLHENIHDRKYLQSINYNLLFALQRSDTGIEGVLEYNAALYKEDTIKKIVDHYNRLLEVALSDVNIRLIDIDILSPQERKRLLYEYNRTETEYVKEQTVQELFEAQVERTPDHLAIVGPHLSSSPSRQMGQISYRVFNTRANQLAGLLRQKGVAPNGIVGMMVERSCEMLPGLLAVVKAGSAYLPIDLDYPEGRLEYILRDSGLEILLTGSESATANVPGFAGDVIAIGDTTIYECDSANPETLNSMADIIYIIYTSGTTGTPKGVLIAQENVLSYVYAFNSEFPVSAGDVFLQQASICFDAFVEEVYPVLFKGGRVAVCPKEVIMDTGALALFMARHSITMVSCSPLLLNEINKFDDLNGIHTFINGGDVLKKDYVSALLEKGRVYNTYGPTETTVCATYYRCSDEDAANPPIGKPITNYKVYIVDRNTALVPPGAAGELCISGDGLSRGYLNRVELTSERFIANPWITAESLYRTGDLARWLPDGNIEYLGRIDDQVQVRGYRLEPGEIEAQLLNYEGIREAVVLAREDRGGEQRYLCAYVVADREFARGELREYLSKELPDYMIPSFYIQLDRIPLTPGGKVDRKRLPQPGITRDREYVAPRNEMEQALAKLWSEVLEIEEDHIGIDADFFESGGYSWKATLLISRIHQVLNVRLPLSEFFRNPTIRALSAYIDAAAKDRYVAIQPVERKDYYPLSSAQKRLYILQQMEPDSVAYNMPQFLPLPGEVDQQKMAATFRKLIARHESLRTSFLIVGDEPVQRVHHTVDFAVEYYDLDDSARDITRDFVKPFNLTKAPLLRVVLIKVSSSQSKILLDMHHIVTDGLSQAILAEELSRIYFEAGLPPLKLQYKDYSQWQNSGHQQGLLKEQEAYWLGEFSGELPALQLPTDYPRPFIQSFKGCRVRFILTENETRILKDLAREDNATLYMSVLSVFIILLAKLSGQEDIIVGTPVAGRRHSDLERIVGMFVNTLPLRHYPAGKKTAPQFLEEVKRRTLQAYENQEYQFEDLVERVSVRRDTGRNPLFDVMFTLLNPDEYGDKIPDTVERSPYEHRKGISKFDMSLTAVDAGTRLFFILEYCTRLFEPGTIERFIAYFKQIIFVLTQNPRSSISQLEIITHREKRRILDEFNATAAEYPGDKTVHQLIEEQVKRTPGAVAAAFEDHQVSYGELNEKANRIAGKLRHRGVKADGIAALAVDRSLEMIIGMVASLKAGGAYLPVDPNYPAARKKFMLENSRAVVLLTQTKYRENDGAVWQNMSADHIFFLDDAAVYAGEAANLNLINQPTDLCYVIYTSGTTGNPKGVMIEHSALINFIFSMYADYNMDFSPFDHCLNLTNFSFDVSVAEIFMPLVFGASIVVLPFEKIFDPHELARAIVERSITFTYIPPGLLKDVYENLKLYQSKLTLNKMLVGVEPIKDYTLENYLTLNRELQMVNGYGPTEATICATTYRYDSHEPADKNVPIGKPLANTNIYLLDKYLHMAPIGIAGELCISGDGLARGYLWSRELTEEKFISNPFKAGDRLYKTGDLARWSLAGYIEFLGRVDHQVKIRGFRIEPGEIEARLMKHEGIEKAVVMDRQREGGEKYLCAYIVYKKSLPPAPPDTGLKEYLSRVLPDHMIPAYFVALAEIPLTANGKTDRQALPEPAVIALDSYVPPRDECEGRLVEIWAEVLGIEKDAVGIDSNFFDLGGHSLSLIKMNTKVKDSFNKHIPVSTLFRLSTVRALAKYLNDEEIDLQVSDEMLEESLETMDETLSLLMEDDSG